MPNRRVRRLQDRGAPEPGSMILSLFRRNAAETIVERLYLQIVAAARQPAFFEGESAVADTVEGRFEVLTLHAFLVLRRLSVLSGSATTLAQDLTNRIFQGFDAALREMGVGDLTVPKRMKTLAGDFGGRNAAYAKALDGAEPLEATLARNVYGRSDLSRARVLAIWVHAADHSLGDATLADFQRGLPPLPALPS